MNEQRERKLSLLIVSLATVLWSLAMIPTFWFLSAAAELLAAPTPMLWAVIVSAGVFPLTVLTCLGVSWWSVKKSRWAMARRVALLPAVHLILQAGLVYAALV